MCNAQPGMSENKTKYRKVFFPVYSFFKCRLSNTILILSRPTCYTSKNGIQELVAPCSFPASFGTSFLLCFVLKSALPWSGELKNFLIKKAWKGSNKHFVEREGKHLAVFWFPNSYWEILLDHPLSFWCGKRMSLSQVFHASRLCLVKGTQNPWGRLPKDT